jgi:hypothetical protein
VNPHFWRIWNSVNNMADTFLARLPSLALGLIVFFCSTGPVFWRTASFFVPRRDIAAILAWFSPGWSEQALSYWVSWGPYSIVAPSFQAADLI